MVRRPGSSSFGLSIASDFDDTRSYRVKLFEIEERESQFGKGQFLFWKMNIYRADGTAFEDTKTEEAFELWASTSDSTFSNPTTGMKAKARAYLEAFMGRDMTDDEVDKLIDDGFEESLVGKTAVGSFEITANEAGDKLTVVKLRPDKAPMRQSEAVAAAAPPAARPARGPRRIDDDGKPPF